MNYGQTKNYMVIDKNGKVFTSKKENIPKEYIGYLTVKVVSNIKGNIVAYFSDLEIDINYRKKGYATKLREKAIKYARKLECTRIETDVYSEDETFKTEDLLEFYKKSFLSNKIKNIEVKNEGWYYNIRASF